MKARTGASVLALTLVSTVVDSARGAESALAAPSGFQGAGLGIADQRWRFWTEFAFHRQNELTVLSPTIGAGYRLIEPLEIEAMVPVVYASLRSSLGDGDNEQSEFVVGNPYLGLNYLELAGTLRFKVGAGVVPPLASYAYLQREARGFAAATFGLQEAQLFLADAWSVSTPARVEMGDELIVALDAALGVIGRNYDAEGYVQAAPGVGGYATEVLLVGARLPMLWLFGQEAQIALEPYTRADFDAAFVNARFTVNLDAPYGFAFSEGRIWGAHVGGGMTF